MAASDAFFPFEDGPQVLLDGGVRAIVQPGGSMRDQLTVELCEQAGVTMYFTGTGNSRTSSAAPAAERVGARVERDCG